MKNRKGFTLIEVISVLVILGLLATIIVTQYATTISKSRKNLNEEQKSRLIEVAKNISLNNKSCLELAKENDSNGVKITIDQMKKNGYIANTQLKDLEESTNLNSCVIIKWDSIYNKFNYEYSNNCDFIATCVVTSESEKVIISSFNIGENNSNYTNTRNVTYNIRYSSSIGAEYCVTLKNEASCNWKKLDPNSTYISGNLNLENVENVVHLYVRNNNRNIITSIDDSIIYDIEAPVCTWRTPTKSYLNNGSSIEITLICNDVAGILNASLAASTINISNPELVTLSDAVVTSSGINKEFKFNVYGLSGNGEVRLSTKPGIISDTSGNKLETERISSAIILDNIAPNADITIGDNNSTYTNTEAITLNFKNASADMDKFCVSNSSEGNCTYVPFTSKYNWTLSDIDGNKTIFVSFEDKAGNINTKSLSIQLDRVAPICRITDVQQPEFGSIIRLKNGGYIESTIRCSDESMLSNNTVITEEMLSSTVAENIEYEVVSSNNAETVVRITAKSGNVSNIKVYLEPDKIKDAAGNGNVRVTIANVTIDNTPPFNNSILINKNSSITNLTNVNLELDSDVKYEGGYYCLKSIDDVNSCENNWVKFSTVSNYEIGNTTGNYTIYAYFKDAAGNISTTAVSDSIKYDRDAIACTLVDYGDFIRISTIGERELADKPYSNALDSGWNDNDKLAKSSNISYYFTYIKDVDGETNYCEYSIKDD